MRLILNFAFISILCGQFEKPYYGFGLDIGSSGSGIFITRQAIHDSENYSLNAEFRF